MDWPGAGIPGGFGNLGGVGAVLDALFVTDEPEKAVVAEWSAKVESRLSALEREFLPVYPGRPIGGAAKEITFAMHGIAAAAGHDVHSPGTGQAGKF